MTWKDLITNIIAVLLAIAEPLISYFNNEPFNWKTFIILLMSSIVAYYTGRKSGKVNDKPID